MTPHPPPPPPFSQTPPRPPRAPYLSQLKGVICAALYPNVMKVAVTTAKQVTSFRFTAGSNEEVFVHPASVNSTAKQYESPWFVYYEKVCGLSSSLRGPAPVLQRGLSLR